MDPAEERGELVKTAFEKRALHGDGESVLFLRSPERDVKTTLWSERLADAGESAARVFKELQRLLAEGGVIHASGQRSVLDG